MLIEINKFNTKITKKIIEQMEDCDFNCNILKIGTPLGYILNLNGNSKHIIIKNEDKYYKLITSWSFYPPCSTIQYGSASYRTMKGQRIKNFNSSEEAIEWNSLFENVKSQANIQIYY